MIDKTIVSHRQSRAVIASEKHEIFIDFQDVNDLINADIQGFVNMAASNEAKGLEEYNRVDDYSERKHKGVAFNMYYARDNDTVVFNPHQLSHYNPHKSMLEIVPAIGTGVIQNNIIADFSFRLGTYVTDKGILRNHQYISYCLLYDFNQDHTFKLNHFLNLGYRYNLSNSLDKNRWIGIGLFDW